MAKGRISKQVFRENKTRQIFRKTNIFNPLIRTRMYVSVSRGNKCSFFRKFAVVCFLETPVLRFALLPHYRRTVAVIWRQYSSVETKCLWKLCPLLKTYRINSSLQSCSASCLIFWPNFRLKILETRLLIDSRVP